MCCVFSNTLLQPLGQGYVPRAVLCSFVDQSGLGVVPASPLQRYISVFSQRASVSHSKLPLFSLLPFLVLVNSRFE